MNFSRHPIRALVLLAAGASSAQQTTQDPAIPPTVVHHPRPHAARPEEPGFNPNVIVLDAAHGGADNGAALPGGINEKDVTIAFVARLKPLLESRGFAVVLTHAAAGDDAPADARVETANRSRAVACVLVHATAGGHGVHLFTSSLTPVAATPLNADDSSALRPIQAWDTAQGAALAQSALLMAELGTAMNGARIPLVAERASMRPIDSLSCPAVALELAPLAPGSEGGQARVEDSKYQQRVAEAASSALTLWRTHAVAAAMQAAITRQGDAARHADATGQKPADTKPKPRPKPKPVDPVTHFPDEAPGDTAAPPAKKPAPIVRQTPATAPPTGVRR